MVYSLRTGHDSLATIYYFPDSSLPTTYYVSLLITTYWEVSLFWRRTDSLISATHYAHYLPLLTMTYHYLPLLTTTHHYSPLLTTTY